MTNPRISLESFDPKDVGSNPGRALVSIILVFQGSE